MSYCKTIDGNGFVSVSTLNAESGGNINKAEYDTIVSMYRTAEPGYGVIETSSGFAYAKMLAPVEDELTDDEALAILLGGDGA